ncbi:unnamed protein product [Prunus armeniaca]|uniref:Uncharacterized protein n=1 Tax=Prunus armeniaca TaxID=36596 RepID=A0A6J5WWM4_PRUAR|nr:unnamed protein product [Prunus armeniaca]
MQANPPHSVMTPDSLKGYVFDIQNKSFSTFQGPRVPKPLGNVISAYEKLYHLAIPVTSPHEPNDPESVFERSGDSRLCGYNHHILLSLTCGPGYEFLAFHVRTQKWVHVKVEKSHRMACSHFPFRGRAVVLGDRMYASSYSFGVVLEFSFDCEAYSLTQSWCFRGLKECILRTWILVFRQSIWFIGVAGIFVLSRLPTTTRGLIVSLCGSPRSESLLEVEESSNIEILHSTIRDVYIHGGWHVHVNFSFTP